EERERDLDPRRFLERRDDLLHVQVLHVGIAAAVEDKLFVLRGGARSGAATRARCGATAAGRHDEEGRDDRCDETKPSLHAVRLPLNATRGTYLRSGQLGRQGIEP